VVGGGDEISVPQRSHIDVFDALELEHQVSRDDELDHHYHDEEQHVVPDQLPEPHRPLEQLFVLAAGYVYGVLFAVVPEGDLGDTGQ